MYCTFSARFVKVASQKSAAPAPAPPQSPGETFGLLMGPSRTPTNPTLADSDTVPMHEGQQDSALSGLGWETCAQLPSQAPVDTLELILATVIE